MNYFFKLLFLNFLPFRNFIFIFVAFAMILITDKVEVKIMK